MMPTVNSATFQEGKTVPATGGQTTNLNLQSGATTTQDVVCGAVQAVLAHPTDINICFAGATNGGVWRTTSCASDLPDWKPLSDSEASLSVGDMYFDTDDTTSNTILVGLGTRSSFSESGGKGVGLIYTQNALATEPTWTLLNNAAGSINFQTNEVKFNSVYVKGTLMLASAYDAASNSCANIGIFRSVDRGITWTNVLQGVGRAIAVDPNDQTRFYATVDFTNTCTSFGVNNGVFTSADSGATWAFTSAVPGVDPLNEGELNNAKLSVSSDGSRVWSAILKNGQAQSISYSDNNGGTWTKMDVVQTPNDGGDPDGLNPREKPGGQGSIHFALLASPNNKDEVYVGGDRQNTPLGNGLNFIGAEDFTGRLFRGDASVTATGGIPSPQWEHMTDDTGVVDTPGGGTASESAPHADCRDMEFRVDGSILESDDGGITIRTSPGDNTGDWFSACGNMQAFESHNVAYEPVLRSVLFGNQDTGSIAGSLGGSDFTSLSTADGNDCMIDFKSSATSLFFYHGTQNFGSFFRTEISKATGADLGFTSLANNFPDGGRGDFVSIAAMNPTDQNEFAVAMETSDSSGKFIAFTNNMGNSFSTVSTPASGTVSAMVWSSDGAVLYGVENNAQSIICPKTTVPVCVAQGTIPTGNNVRHLAVDSTNNNNVYAVATSSSGDFTEPQAFFSSDAGATWTDISVTGSLLATAAQGGSVAFLNDKVAIGTSNGVLVPDGGVGVGWQVLAPGLPNTAILDMVYEATDDTLVVAMFGRGVW